MNLLVLEEFENLLINCQLLDVLTIVVFGCNTFRWDKLYEILAKSSPPNTSFYAN